MLSLHQLHIQKVVWLVGGASSDIVYVHVYLLQQPLELSCL